MNTRICCAVLIALAIQSASGGTAHTRNDHESIAGTRIAPGADLDAEPLAVAPEHDSVDEMILQLERHLAVQSNLRALVQRAVWIDSGQRIQLGSLCPQSARTQDHEIDFTACEQLMSEYCHQAALDAFVAKAAPGVPGMPSARLVAF
jgi:hypothetical protein